MAFNKEQGHGCGPQVRRQGPDRQGDEGVPADRPGGSEGRPRLAQDRRPLREEGREAGRDRDLSQGRALLSRAGLLPEGGRGLQADPQARSAPRRREPEARRAVPPARPDVATRCSTTSRSPRTSIAKATRRKRSTTVKKLVDLDPENVATRIKLAELYSKEGHRRGRGRRVHHGVRAAAPAGPPGRLHQGRRAPALAQARQPSRSTASSPGSTCAATIRGARCRSCRRASRPTRATSRRSACSRTRSRRSTRRRKTVSVLKELARIHVENRQARKARRGLSQDPRVRAERPRREGVPRRNAALARELGAAGAGRRAASLEPAPRTDREPPGRGHQPDRLAAGGQPATTSTTRRAACSRSSTTARPRIVRRSASGRMGAINDFDVSEPSDLVAELSLEDERFEPRATRRARRGARRGDREDPHRDRRLREVRPAPEGGRSPAPGVRRSTRTTSRRTSGSRTSSSRRAASGEAEVELLRSPS